MSRNLAARPAIVGRPDYSRWVTKAVAASRLDVATKTIEQWDKAGTLPGTLYRRPTGGPRIRVYDPGRVADLAAQRRAVRPVAVLGPGAADAGPVLEAGALGAGESAALTFEPLALSAEVEPLAGGAVAAFLEALRVFAVEHSATSEKSVSQSSQRLVLTLAEAAAVSGWSVGYLRRARAEGRLRADRDRWRGTDGRWHVGWKVRRADLEGL